MGANTARTYPSPMPADVKSSAERILNRQLAELDKVYLDKRAKLLYVATSRTRSHLIILGGLRTA